MVGSSKILTVSYGTFSCTLEGFDDSFSTMKAIAEYFRDLAADDRYFGAEPPTPDAEMLARIAEREIARRVEARTEGTGIVLKAGQALSAPEAPEEADEADEAVSTEAGTMPVSSAEDEAPEVAADEVEAQTDQADESPTELISEETAFDEADDATAAPEEDLAESLADTAVEPADEAPETPDVASDAGMIEQTEAVSDSDETDPWDYEAAASKLAESLAARPTPHRVAPTRVMPPVQEPPATDLRSEDVVDLPPVLTAPPAHPDADSVAAKLERIRAVVGKSASQDEETENEHAFAPLPSAPLSPLEADEPVAEYEAPDLNERVDQTPEPREVEVEPPVSRDEAQDEGQEDRSTARRPVRTRVIKMSLADFQRSLGRGEIEPAAEQDAPVDTGEEDHAGPEHSEPAGDGMAVETTGSADAVAGDMSDDFDDFDDLSDYEFDDISDEDIADLAALDGTTPQDAAGYDDEDDAAALTDAEEAELLAELAELERGDDIEAGTELPAEGPFELSRTDEIAAEDQAEEVEDAVASDIVDEDVSDDTAETVAEERIAAQSHDEMASWEASDDDDEDDRLNLFGGEDDEEEPGSDRPILSDDDEEDDEADTAIDPRALRRQRAFGTNPDEDNEVLSRLIEHTDDQLNDPDTNRRRESITQLKAAVAAKEAARQMGEQDKMSDETADEFRNDLRQAVRPRRPARVSDRPTTRTERPQIAPLKLVASQRVDLDPEEAVAARRPVSPVRPRRVRLDEASEAEAARDAGSFEVFARDMGAQGLAELLEAAAAYTAYVEGSEDFSRPQLMSKVRGLADRDFSREEGLRSFGTLLREGRIMKVRNGRFQVSEETRFHPERRAG